MKRGQLETHALMHAVFAFVAVFVLAFGYVQISTWQGGTEQLDLINFERTLTNAIERQTEKSVGTVDERAISIPNSVNSVCFVDRNKDIQEWTNVELSSEFSIYDDKNVFFEPVEQFAPMRIENLEVDQNPLCIRNKAGAIPLQLHTLKETSKIVAQPHDQSFDCTSVLYHKDPGKAVDIVFIPLNYDDIEKFQEDVTRNIDVFATNEPFKSNIHKFNFYRIDDKTPTKCEISSYVKCDNYELKQIASFCPHDYIIVLADNSPLQETIKPFRSSAIGNIEKINTQEPELVVLHEFGHTFGGLADEYVYDSHYEGNFDHKHYPNCDESTCQSWEDVDDTGCFEGCSLSNLARPTRTSIMKSLSENDWGPVNLRTIQELLDHYEE